LPGISTQAAHRRRLPDLNVALAVVPTFNCGWEQPSDFPDVLFMTAFAAVGSDTQTIVSIWETIVSLAEAVNQPSLTRWPVLAVAMFGPVVLWLLSNRTRLDRKHVGLVAVAAGVTVLTLCTGLASELRRHLPALAVLLYIAVATDSGWRLASARTVLA